MVRLGYLDVAIAKIRETHMQSCAIDYRGYLDAAVAKIFLSVKLAKNGRENIWSVKVGVHLRTDLSTSNLVVGGY